MTDDPKIHIVEGLIPKPGDKIVLLTQESLSPDSIYALRGRLAGYFEKMGVEVIIFAGADMFIIRPEEEESS